MKLYSLIVMLLSIRFFQYFYYWNEWLQIPLDPLDYFVYQHFRNLQMFFTLNCNWGRFNYILESFVISKEPSSTERAFLTLGVSALWVTDDFGWTSATLATSFGVSSFWYIFSFYWWSMFDCVFVWSYFRFNFYTLWCSVFVCYFFNLHFFWLDIIF